MRDIRTNLKKASLVFIIFIYAFQKVLHFRSSPSSIFHEDAFFFKLHKYFSSWWKQTGVFKGLLPSCNKTESKNKGCLTTQILQDEVEFPPSLERIQQIHNERVSHRLQDLPLCSCMGCVFGVTNNLSLQTEEQEERLDWKKSAWKAVGRVQKPFHMPEEADLPHYLFQYLHGKNFPHLSSLNLPDLKNLTTHLSVMCLLHAVLC